MFDNECWAKLSKQLEKGRNKHFHKNVSFEVDKRYYDDVVGHVYHQVTSLVNPEVSFQNWVFFYGAQVPLELHYHRWALLALWQVFDVLKTPFYTGNLNE